MLKINKFVTAAPEQYEIVIEGMRYPLDSVDKMDSSIEHLENPETMHTADWQFHFGENDYALAKRLAKAGSDHGKFRRMLPVWVSITAPLYWWKEFDTYKVGTTGNSSSTMHTIAKKEFTLDDFSCEKLLPNPSMKAFKETIDALNTARNLYLECNDPVNKKDWWNNLIQLLPTSYNQKRLIFLNYEVLANIYHARKNHKLDEWHVFCDWIKKLPYSELITCEDVDSVEEDPEKFIEQTVKQFHDENEKFVEKWFEDFFNSSKEEVRFSKEERISFSESGVGKALNNKIAEYRDQGLIITRTNPFDESMLIRKVKDHDRRSWRFHEQIQL